MIVCGHVTTHLPHATHVSLLTLATPSMIPIESNSQTPTQSPRPIHPCEQAELPLKNVLAPAHDCIPCHSRIFLEASHVPLHITCAICLSAPPAARPSMLAICSAQAAPPTVQALQLVDSSLTTAFA